MYHKKFFYFTVGLYISLSFSFATAGIHPELEKKLQSARGDEQLKVIVRLKEKPEIKHLRGKRAAVLSVLREKNLKNQHLITSGLKQKKQQKIKKIRNFWLLNGFALTATREEIEELSKNPLVDQIHEDFIINLPPHEKSTPINSYAVEWGISKIKADQVWSTYGFKGSGIRVGHLDTGADITHPDLAGKLITWAEFDGDGNQVPGSTAHDSDTHGTHTAGTILGGNASGNYIGVAPEASLISGLVLNGGSGTFSQVVAGMEWVIDPDGNPDTDDGAQVVNMSLGADGTYPEMIEPTDNMVTTGTFPSFSIGNSGQGNTGSPGNIPSAFGVGATDSSDQVAYFSGGGNVTWNAPPYVGTYLKPDISAPGVSVKSSVPGGGYDTYQGTSMAAPHVTGAVALLLQADPSLTVSQLKQLLIDTSVDYGAGGQDDRYGWGRMDIYAAVTQVANSGVLTGTIKNIGTTPLNGATIKITETGVQTSADTNGLYTINLAEGTYTVEASSYGYVTQTQANVQIVQDQTTTLNFNLASATSGTLSGAVTDVTSGTPLNATIYFLNTPVNPVTTNPVTGIYTKTLYTGTYSVKATAAGYQNQTINNVTITADTTTTLNFALSPNPPILLVDDDAGNTYEIYYTNVLDAIGRSYDTWNVANQGSPSLETLNGYEIIIWFTGSADYSTLTSSDQTNLSSFLSNGGKLFITGQDIGYDYDVRNSSFYSTYLHAKYIKDDTDLSGLNGISGSIMNGITISISGGDGANNQTYPSEVDTLAPATQIFTYNTGSSSLAHLPHQSKPGTQGANPQGIISSGTGGLAVDTGTYKVAYLSFGFEAINSQVARQQVMENILNWLGSAPDTTAPYGTPSPPTDEGATSPLQTITFTWTQGTAVDPESGITGFNIMVSTSPTFDTYTISEDIGYVFSKQINNCVDGLTYYAKVRAKNGVSLYSEYSSGSDGILISIDSTPPTGMPSKPSAGSAQTRNTTITFSWSQNTAADAESGISGYYLQVGTTPGGNDKYDGDVGNILSKQITNCTVGATYYAKVRAENGADLYSNYSEVSDGILILAPDITAPSGPQTINDGSGADIDATSQKNQLTANWESAIDSDSTISKYYYAIGSTPGNRDIVPWTDIGSSRSVTQTGLSLTDGTTYYFTIKALNESGVETEPIYSGYQETLMNHVFLGAGTAKNWRGDDLCWYYNLPFSFPFYGQNYAKIYIATNGCIFLDSSSTDSKNSLATLKSRKMIAPLWDDLRTNGGGQSGEDIYISQPDASSLCIRWRAETVSGAYPVNVELILYNNGCLKFNYDAGNTSLTPTVGLSAGDGENFFLSKYDSIADLTQVQSSYLTNEAKVYFSSDGQMVDSTPPSNTPGTPSTPSAYSDSTLTVNWDQAECFDKESGITSYYLEVSTSTNFSTTSISANVGNVKQYGLAGCTNGLTYYARVKAGNGSGLYGSWSLASSGTIIDNTSPTGKPSIPTDAGSYTNSTTISFAWTQNTSADEQSGISGYYLQVSTSTTFEPLTFAADVGAILSKQIANCQNNLSYYARVRAKNGAGSYSEWSGTSDGITVYGSLPQGTPAKPAIAKKYVAGSEITFTWEQGTATDETGIIGYYLQVSTHSDFSSSVFEEDVGNVTTKTIGNCLENTSYYARVKAKNGAGSYSAWSEISEGIMIDNTPPTCSLTFATASSPFKTGSHSITLSIQDNGEIEQTPSLSFVPIGNAAIPITLSGANKNWTGSVIIESTTADGTATFSATITDAAGNIGTTITTGTTFDIEKTIKAAEGGTISNKDGTQIFIPPAILPYDTAINITITIPDQTSATLKEITDKTQFDRGVQIIASDNTVRTITATNDVTGAALHSLNGFASITIPYPDSNQDGIVDNTTVKETALRIFYLDETKKRWSLLPNISLDTAGNTVSTEVNHFSTFCVMGYVAGDLLGLDQTFCYPNPCYPNKGERVNIVNLPIDVNTKVHIYNLVGELIRTLEEGQEIEFGAGSETAVWDAKNEEGEIVASGIYIYVIETEFATKPGKKICILK